MFCRRVLELSILFLLAVLLALPGFMPWSAAPAQEPKAKGDGIPVVFRAATIHSVSGPVIQSGVLIVLNGQIVAVGAADKVPIPKNAFIRDMSGAVILPGMVDPHAHVGI